MVWLCSWQPPSRRYPSRRLWSRRCLSTWCSSWSFRCSSFSPPSRCGCPGCLTLSNPPESRLVLVERLEEGVAKLTLNNPPLNLVTLEMTRQLIEALQELERDEAVRAVVVAGAGDKAFCAGSDVKEFAAVRDRVVEKKLAQENEAFSSFESLSKPVIAAIEGLAYGGGCEISMACDIRVIAEGARVALPEVKLGVVPGSGGLFRLPRLVGPAHAMELMYLGDPISAREAEQMGLVNKVVPDGEALPHALNVARKIAQQPRASVAAIKRGVKESARLA